VAKLENAKKEQDYLIDGLQETLKQLHQQLQLYEAQHAAQQVCRSSSSMDPTHVACCSRARERAKPRWNSGLSTTFLRTPSPLRFCSRARLFTCRGSMLHEDSMMRKRQGQSVSYHLVVTAFGLTAGSTVSFRFVFRRRRTQPGQL